MRYGNILVTLVTLSLVTSVFLVLEMQTSAIEISGLSTTTWFVGGSGPGNYSSIQDAIDNASNGDTIFVFSGIYYENIVIDKTVDLIGEERNNTIIEGSAGLAVYTVVNIPVDDVTISGFTIKNSANLLGIYIHSNNNTISNNILKDNNRGILILDGFNNNTISDNSFLNNGIVISFTYHNTVENNTINDKPLVYLEDKSDDIVIDAGQVILVNCNNITVENLNLMNASIGVQLVGTNNSKIKNINCSYNGDYGISLMISNNNFIIKNILYKNTVGILLWGSDKNLLYHNNFITNGQYQAVDISDINYWNSTFGEGNYWEDYTGEDADSDGIGDTPYVIYGGPNKDYFPLMKPYDSSSELELDVEIKRGIGRKVTVVIRNNGQTDAVDVKYNITVKGGVVGFIDKTAEDIIPLLEAGNETRVDISVFGLGIININATAGTANEKVMGIVFAKFVYIPRLLNGIL